MKICYYHANCRDGWAAYWLAQMVVEFDIVIPYRYGDSLTPQAGSDVWFLDCCPEPGFPFHMFGQVTIIDHHMDRIKSHRGFPRNVTLIADEGKSGAGLVMDHFSSLRERNPWMIPYVQDRDLWTWKLPNSREVNAYIQAIPMSVESWDTLEASDREAVAQRGETILAYQESLLERIIKDRVVFDTACAVNSSILESEIGDKLSDQYNLVLIFKVVGVGKVKVSCRSRNGEALIFAKAHGGGGHPNAAGYVSDSLPF